MEFVRKFVDVEVPLKCYFIFICEKSKAKIQK